MKVFKSRPNRFSGYFLFGIVTTGLLMAPVLRGSALAVHAHEWTAEDRETLRSLRIDSLPEIPPNPSNAFASNPDAAVLGKKFFFDTRFSGNLKVSCGTCHRTDYVFTDDLPLAHGMGTTARRTMPLIGMAYQPWFFWDGRKDSLWSQALGPIESKVEHGFSRTLCFSVIREAYRTEYENVFGPLPSLTEGVSQPEARPATDDADALKAWITMSLETKNKINRVYSNMGKAIEAYVRTIIPSASRFDDYVAALLEEDRGAMEKALTENEARGLKLFIGKAKCINCHNGPLFTNGEFHNVGVPDPEGSSPDRGRADGIISVLADEFNCLGPYSDARPEQCAELRYMDTATEKHIGAFKTPSLRNVARRPPYMHAGQLATLSEVMNFYRETARVFVEDPGYHPDIEHGDLSDADLANLEAFLKTLNSPLIEAPPSGKK